MVIIDVLDENLNTLFKKRLFLVIYEPSFFRKFFKTRVPSQPRVRIN